MILLIFIVDQDWVKRHPRGEPVLRGLASSLLLVGGLDLMAAFLQAASDKPNRERFERFFGKGVHHGVIAVFPSPRLNKDPMDPNFNPDFNPLTFVHAPTAAQGKNAAKGFDYLIVSQDLQATLELADTFRAFDENFITKLDYELEEQPLRKMKQCLIAVGLGFNNLTAQIRDYHSKGNLFSIIFPDYTDDFKINDKFHAKPSESKDYALLVRGTAKNASDTNPHFVCAGRTATGTKAAGIFLARQWEQLFRLYAIHGKNLATDSLAVLLEFDPKNEKNGAYEAKISWDFVDKHDDPLDNNKPHYNCFFVSTNSQSWGIEKN